MDKQIIFNRAQTIPRTSSSLCFSNVPRFKIYRVLRKNHLTLLYKNSYFCWDSPIDTKNEFILCNKCAKISGCTAKEY